MRAVLRKLVESKAIHFLGGAQDWQPCLRNLAIRMSGVLARRTLLSQRLAEGPHVISCRYAERSEIKDYFWLL